MSAYTVYVIPAAKKDIKNVPARFRARVKNAIDAFADDPRPSKSKAMKHSSLRCKPRRLRLENWRVIYAIVEEDKAVDVLAVRKRPPYKYEDLEQLLEDYSRAKDEPAER